MSHCVALILDHSFITVVLHWFCAILLSQLCCTGFGALFFNLEWNEGCRFHAGSRETARSGCIMHHDYNFAHSVINQRQLERRKAGQDFVHFIVFAHADWTRIHGLHVMSLLQRVFRKSCPNCHLQGSCNAGTVPQSTCHTSHLAWYTAC